MAEPAEILREIFDLITFLLYAVVQILYSLVKFALPVCYEPVKTASGETILITGGGSGLGRLLAIKLAKLRAKIIIWDINEQGLEETVRLVKSTGGKIYSYKCDLSNREEVYKIADVTKREVGEVSILINNAGVLSGYHFLDIPDHLIKRTFDVNSLALFWTTKAFLPDMIKSNKGHIVTIASMAGLIGCTKLVDYCASKYAAVGFDESLRLELEAKGLKNIKTTVVCPFFIASTGMFGDVITKHPVLSLEKVVDRIILGILREDIIVMLPKYLRYVYWLRWVVPWPVVSKMMIDLVPDASPTPRSS